ncbi:MAG TPA: hypothetical protein VFK37_09840 [Bacillales bacterium]|nr:hypothetical protein [Bacillales bacterium]
MKKLAILIFVLSLLTIVSGGVFQYGSSYVSRNQGVDVSMIKKDPERNPQTCEHSPLLIEPPNKRQYYMGRLSQKDLRRWPSGNGTTNQMPTPPNQKCTGK